MTCSAAQIGLVELGAQASLTFTFTDQTTGNLVNPSAIVVMLKSKGGKPTSYTLDAGSPVSLGTYVWSTPPLDKPGTWTGKVYADGGFVARSPDFSVEVSDSDFPPNAP